MKPVSPNIGGDERIVGEESLEWRPLPAVRVRGEGEPFESWMVRWTFTTTERARIAAGEDITITMPKSVHPHAVRLFGDNFPAAPPPGGEGAGR